MVIWKFPLETIDEQSVTVPIINRPLCIQVNNGKPCLWMVVDPEAERVRVRIRVFGTGHPGVTADMDYIGTYQIEGGSLVFHVFLAGVVL